jgi:hypothetical protein
LGAGLSKPNRFPDFIVAKPTVSTGLNDATPLEPAPDAAITPEDIID